jgi:hypothetical protein
MHNNKNQIISGKIKSNKVLINYLKGNLIGKDKSELIELLQKLIPYKNKLPNILKPEGTIFYRVDVIERTPELEQNIIENGISIRDKPYIRQLSKLNADLLKNIEYKPKDIIQGWTSEEEFVWEHWYNVYIHGQGRDYIFDDEKYFAAIYITNNLKDFIFNEDWLDEFRSEVGGNGYEKESLRLGKNFNCNVIIINNLEDIDFS